MRAITVLWLGLALGMVGGCGKKEELSAPAPAVAEAPQATYAWIEKNVLQTKCLDCHSPQKAKGDVVLAGYEKVMENVTPGSLEKSALWIEVDGGTMPKGRGKLPDEHLGAIKQWILDGAKSQ